MKNHSVREFVGNPDVPGVGSAKSLGSAGQAPRTIKLSGSTLPPVETATTFASLPVKGTTISINPDSDAQTVLIIGADNDEPSFRMRKGMKLHVPNGFEKLTLRRGTNTPAGAAIYVDVSWDETDVTYINDSVVVGAAPGATNIASGQATAGVAAANVVASRATRRRLKIKNRDAANSIYVGPTGVTTASGQEVYPGEVVEIATTAAVQAIALVALTPYSYIEEYD